MVLSTRSPRFQIHPNPIPSLLSPVRGSRRFPDRRREARPNRPPKYPMTGLCLMQRPRTNRIQRPVRRRPFPQPLWTAGSHPLSWWRADAGGAPWLGGEGFVVLLLGECGEIVEEDPDAFVEQRLSLIRGKDEAPSWRSSLGTRPLKQRGNDEKLQLLERVLEAFGDDLDSTIKSLKEQSAY